MLKQIESKRKCQNVVVFVSDVDECSASSPVCDVNVICNNTRGSLIVVLATRDSPATGKLAKVSEIVAVINEFIATWSL